MAKQMALTKWLSLGLAAVLIVVFALHSSPAAAQTLFFDDFEGDLSQWVGKTVDGGAHNGEIVDDPLRPGNHVVTFTALNSNGDIFGLEVSVTPGQTLVLSFEYLGLPDLGGTSGDLGGFIGFAEDTAGGVTPGGVGFLAGTILCAFCDVKEELIDDGQWNPYSIEFDPFEATPFKSPGLINNTIRVLLEDFSGSGGVAGDAFFDNVRLTVAGPAGPLTITVDIKPGSDPNSINPKRKGVIPVAILTTAGFDATTVDPLSVEFGPDGATESHGKGHIQDVDGDNDNDLLLHFKTQETGIAKGDTEACLTGRTFGGDNLEGCDAIKTVGK